MQTLISLHHAGRRRKMIHCRHCDGIQFVVDDWMLDRGMSMITVRCARLMCNRFYIVSLEPGVVWGNAGRDHGVKENV